MEFYALISKDLSVDSALGCAGVYQPPTPKGEYILGMPRILAFCIKNRIFDLHKLYSPSGVGGSRATVNCAKSTSWYKSLTCTDYFRVSDARATRKFGITPRQRRVSNGIKSGDVIQRQRLDLIAPPTHSHEN